MSIKLTGVQTLALVQVADAMHSALYDADENVSHGFFVACSNDGEWDAQLILEYFQQTAQGIYAGLLNR